jgi:hypothetical protein
MNILQINKEGFIYQHYAIKKDYYNIWGYRKDKWNWIRRSLYTAQYYVKIGGI